MAALGMRRIRATIRDAVASVPNYDRRVGGPVLIRVLAAVAAAVALTGCSRQEDPTMPAACKEGPAAVRAALERAPGEVRLGQTSISSCFVERSNTADVQAIGATLIAVAVDLAPEARRRPEGDAALQLGYLLGAVRRGAAHTQGIHDELVRRLEQELVGSETGAAFREGERAGRRSG
jgi:hypothetical protein